MCLVLIAQAVFLLERGHAHTDEVTDVTDYLTDASASADVGNKRV